MSRKLSRSPAIRRKPANESPPADNATTTQQPSNASQQSSAVGPVAAKASSCVANQNLSVGSSTPGADGGRKLAIQDVRDEQQRETMVESLNKLQQMERLKEFQLI